MEAKNYISFCISEIRKKYELVFLSGNCRGADLLGEKYAEENSFKIERYIAEWNKYGKAAGPKRNKIMADEADYIICFWDGKSKGTKSLIDYVSKTGKPIKIKKI